MTARRSLTGLTTLSAVVASVAGCAIQADSGPRDVPEEHPARVVLDPTGEGGEATGEGRIFLVAPVGGAQQLRTVLRDDKLPEPLIETLIRGPNTEELNDGLTTELPTTLELLDARFDGGILYIDVSEEINELQGEPLVLAVAQIVFTASEIPGTESVLIRVNGEPQSWPNGDGDQQSDPLTVYDFSGLAESSQPAYPVTPTQRSIEADATTTTAVAPTTTAAATTVPAAPTTETPPNS